MSCVARWRELRFKLDGKALPQNTRVIRLVKGRGIEATLALVEGTVKFRLPLS